MTGARKPNGGARAGAGRPSKGGDARSVAKTVKLTPAELVAQETTAGDTKWATWAHDTLVAAARSEDEAMLAALRHLVEPQYSRVSDAWYVSDYAPASAEHGGSTEPGSPWDEECDRLLAEIRAALPPGWTVDWSDDDIRIERIESE